MASAIEEEAWFRTSFFFFFKQFCSWLFLLANCILIVEGFYFFSPHPTKQKDKVMDATISP